MTALSGKRILLVIGGGIAAYKSLDLIRRLRERGASVRCILTAGAQQFITPPSAPSLSGARTPPAMNVRMWLHPATQRNLAALQADGIRTVGPNEGAMAEAETGPGRMAEPLEIVAAVEDLLAPSGPLAGKHVIVTSGPTHEPIDPVRYIANRSSGKQGHAIAKAAAEAGARVTLIAGSVTLPDPAGMTVVHVESAREMLQAVEQALPADIGVFAAAVADWHVANAGEK